MIPKIEFFWPALSLGHEHYVVFRKENGQAYLVEFLPTEWKTAKFEAPLGTALSTRDARAYLDELLFEDYLFEEFVLDLTASDEEDLVGEEPIKPEVKYPNFAIMLTISMFFNLVQCGILYWLFWEMNKCLKP